MTTAPRLFTVIDAPQRSDEWHAARLGRVTGSRAEDMLATVKSGEAVGRRNLRTQLVLERITGRIQDSGFQSSHMQRGTEMEPEACAAYEHLTDQVVQHSGFLRHDELMVGCSLDGHVGDFDGIIEIKCPQATTHLGYLRSGVVPNGYMKQVVHNLWVSGADWCDWFSYHPEFPPHLRINLIRVLRNDAVIAQYERQVKQFLAEVEAEYEEISSMSVDLDSITLAA